MQTFRNQNVLSYDTTLPSQWNTVQRQRMPAVYDYFYQYMVFSSVLPGSVFPTSFSSLNPNYPHVSHLHLIFPSPSHGFKPASPLLLH